MTDISAYLSFVLKLFFAFGLAFEVPVATVLMVRMGMTTPDNLAAKRPYIIVGAFVVGMLMTPPDIFSQTMLALPVWILFEAGLYVSRSITPRSRDDEDEVDEVIEPDPGNTAEDADLERDLDEGIAEFDDLSGDEDAPRS